MGCIRTKLIVYSIISLLFLGTNSLSQVQGETRRDGMYLFSQFKDAIIYVLNRQQKIINTNPDGSVKNKQLESEVYFKRIYKQFKKMEDGRNFRPKSLEGVRDPEIIAPVLVTLLQAGRIVTAESQGIINAEKDGTNIKKKFIPAVFGHLVLTRFNKKTNSSMKQTTLGKGKHKQRNDDNRPDLWETEALKKFSQSDWKRNSGYGEFLADSYHFIQPIYISKDCLSCHGLPVGEDAPYGYPKEGYQEGEIRGGISVSLPVK